MIGIGVGFGKTFVPNVYQKYLSAALPSAVPNGLRALIENDEVPDLSNKEKWQESTPLGGGSESIADILRHKTNIFKEDLEALKSEREAKLVKGEGAGSMTVDLCFVVDFTGSMTSYVKTLKENIKGINSFLLLMTVTMIMKLTMI